MKKTLFLLILTVIIAFNISAKEKSPPPDTYDYDNLVTSITGAGAPLITEEYIVFTAKNESRSVGVAFDFENYNKIHSYSLRRTYDIEGEETNSWYFFVLEKPKKLTSISYKIIIDGLWTTDPLNPNTIYDWKNGIQLSHLEIPESQKIVTESVQEGYTRFVFNTEPGKKVRLAGSFTNWDSWIYEMTEVEPGKYEILLPLPAGTYHYAYFVGLKSFIDTTNPNKAYSADGKTVSTITVN